MVKFINNDKCFFECSEAEARRAIDFLKDERFNNEAGKRREAETEERKKHYRKITNQIHQWINQPVYAYLPVDSGLSITVLNKAFALVETSKGVASVSYVIINSTTYADIRNWGRTVYEEATDTMKKNFSVLGHIWGAEIIVDNTVPKDLVILVWRTKDKTETYQATLFKLEQVTTKTPPEIVCRIDELVMAVDQLKRTIRE